MDVTKELAKRLGISETMAADQLQRDPSLASIVTGQTVPMPVATAVVDNTALDEETKAKQKSFATLQDVIKSSEPGLSPSAKLAEKFPNLAPEARTELLANKYTLSEMAEPEKTSPASLLASFKQATEKKEEVKPQQLAEVVTEPTKTKSAKPSLKQAISTAPVKAPPSLAEPTPSPYEQSMAELKGERATAKAERDADLRRAEIGELASIIGRSLTQIGAAASGMRSGADMSGIAQQALVDWDKRKDQVMNLYKQNVAELEGQQTKLERAKERADDKAEKEVYQREQMKLAREKLKQDRDIAAQNSEIKMLSAIATRDAKAIQNSEKQYTNALEELDKQDLNFRKVEELDLEGKDKKVIAGEIAKLLGREAVEEAGIIWGTNVKSKDDLMNIITEKRNEIKAQKDRIKKNLGTITGFQARANAPGPTAPVPAEAPAGQDAQIANYAKQNNLDYNRAKDILVKRGYTPKE